VTLRAAVIGCGAIGAGGRGEPPPHADVGVYTHAGAYAACPDTELVAVADVDSARAREAANGWGAADAYSAAGELLAAARPELVSLCTPDPTHAALLEEIVTTPGVRGVLAEKPLADDAAKAAALTRLARDRGVVLAVNYSRRFAPAIVAVANAIRAGEMGELQHIHGSYGKGLRHNGTHWFDLLRMLAGEPIAARGWDRLQEGGADPSFDAELLLPAGAGARLAALDAREFTAFEFELTGTAGRVRLANSGHRIERWAVGPDERYPGYRGLVAAETDDGVLRDVTLHAVSDLARCVHGGGEPACSGRDATSALVIAEAIAASAASEGRIMTIGSLRLDG
jgi:predicted dehydrogenase